MQTYPPQMRSDRRPSSGPYGEPTVPLRVPAKLVDETKSLIRKAGRKLPLYVVGTQQSPVLEPQVRARIGSGTTLGVSRVYVDGGLDAQALRFEGNIGSRTVGVDGGVQRFAGPDCIGVCIEEPFRPVLQRQSFLPNARSCRTRLRAGGAAIVDDPPQ